MAKREGPRAHLLLGRVRAPKQLHHFARAHTALCRRRVHVARHKRHAALGSAALALGGYNLDGRSMLVRFDRQPDA